MCFDGELPHPIRLCLCVCIGLLCLCNHGSSPCPVKVENSGPIFRVPCVRALFWSSKGPKAHEDHELSISATDSGAHFGEMCTCYLVVFPKWPPHPSLARCGSRPTRRKPHTRDYYMWHFRSTYNDIRRQSLAKHGCSMNLNNSYPLRLEQR